MLLQLKVVAWKNYIIRKNHYILTIIEFLLPTLLFLIFAYLVSLACRTSDKYTVNAVYNNPKELEDESIGVYDEDKLYYAPDTVFHQDLMKRVQVKFPSLKEIRGFPTSDELLQYYDKHHENTHTTATAVVFNGDGQETLDYTIRAYQSRYITAHLYKNAFNFYPGLGTPYSYKHLMIQKSLDMAFIEKISGRKVDNNVKIMVQEFPYPSHKLDSYVNEIFTIFLPIITLVSFIAICPAVLKRVVEEKCTGTKELLKMAGMKSWMLWLGWFIHGMIPMLFSVVSIVVLLKTPIFNSDCTRSSEAKSVPPVELTDGSVLFVFLLLYCMAAIVFCFAISALFCRPNIAVVVGLLVWILSYFVPKYGLNLDEVVNKYPWSLNMILNLFPNMALYYGYKTIFLYENKDTGLQWNNFYKSSSGGSEDISMLNIFGMLIIDIVLYMCFTLYMEGVYPGKFGVRKPFLFPIYSLLNSTKRPWTTENSAGLEPLHDHYVDYVEEGRGLVKGIEVQDLVKRFGHKTVVNNLTLNIYQNQITVLLGHNGAGKSTTMSMITGMLDATSGTIRMSGKDVRNNIDEVRQSLGLCPQHNLLFTDLTVGEHLVLFAMLKGKTLKEAQEEMLQLLDILHLSEKRNAMTHTLSGGMKRKLCLGMAVIGGSKVLILDEPTSGMDPESRRELWELLLAWRGEKTILITTHFMEEADALGDWIAIMADGKLRCHGTPIYLKKAFDTGYHLSLIVTDDATPEERDVIKDNIKAHIGCAELKECNGNNMVFVLPLEDNSKIADLLAFLEQQKDYLKIENISVTVTTLEDVFLKVKVQSGVDSSEDNELDIQNTGRATASGVELFIMRLTALITKKLQFYKIKLWTYLIPTIIGILIFLLGIYLSGTVGAPDDAEPTELQLQLGIYQRTTVFYNGTKRNSLILKMEKVYKSLAESNKGTATEVEDVEEEQNSPLIYSAFNNVCLPCDLVAEIIAKATGNIPYYKQYMIVGAQFKVNNSIQLTALYSGVAIHSAPISLNLITNTLAKVQLGHQFSIKTSVWPLPSIDSSSPRQYEVYIVAPFWAFLIPIGFLIIIGSFIVFPHVELSTNFVQLQNMSGIRPHFYWLVNFIVDLTFFSIISLAITTIAVFTTPYIHATEFGYLYLILVVYGAANLAFMYLFSRKKSAAAGFVSFVTLGIFLGTIIMIIAECFIRLGNSYHQTVGHTLRVIFTLILPQVGFVHALYRFSVRAILNYNLSVNCNINSVSCCKGGVDKMCLLYTEYMPSLLEDISLLLCSCVIYITLNILLDTYIIKKAFSKTKYLLLNCSHRPILNRLDTSDQYQHFNNSTNEENCNSLKARNLHKSYRGTPVVKNIDFTLREKECLGILGVNGAGKTTTFRMLTRDEIADGGHVEIIHKRYKKPITIEQKEYFENIGYCPQTDALNFVLTGRQILSLMSRLRGVNDPEVVNKFLKLFELEKYADMSCSHYSGGNKRKLSLAVALIGFPKFVLLDEPTSGVDPSSCRKFWNLIRIFKDKKDLSFILTSHSMAECEALCNYLKIMKEGRFEKEGTISELKKEYAGFNVKLKLVNKGGLKCLATEEGSSGENWTNNDTFTNIYELKEHFRTKYNGSVKDEHAGLLHIHIQDKTMKWSTIFKTVERIKMRNSHLIEDYTISEATLEDVFLTVARSDKGKEKAKTKKGRAKNETV